MNYSIPPIIKVDANGLTDNGDDVKLIASEEPVRLGYMVNVAVLAEYPDGKLVDANPIKVTPKGMDFFRRTLPVEMRRTEGSA